MKIQKVPSYVTSSVLFSVLLIFSLDWFCLRTALIAPPLIDLTNKSMFCLVRKIVLIELAAKIHFWYVITLTIKWQINDGDCIQNIVHPTPPNATHGQLSSLVNMKIYFLMDLMTFILCCDCRYFLLPKLGQTLYKTNTQSSLK